MSTAQKWIVCERSGRWAAAVRVAFARSPNSNSAPRLTEVRQLADLSARLAMRDRSLALIEIRPENLAVALNFISQQIQMRDVRLVVLMDYSLWQVAEQSETLRGFRKQQIAGLFWEAGAVEVIDSPRRVQGLLDLHDRLAIGSEINRPVDGQSVAEWAHSCLPWQDT